MSKNTLLLTETADTVSTETSQSTSPQSTSQSSSQSTLRLTSQSLSQRQTKIRKTNVFKSSGLYLPIIVVIYLSL